MTEEEFELELKSRIDQVENGVDGVTPMKKKDYIEVAVLAGVCLFGILAGAFL